MSTDREPGDDEDSPFPACPRCGDPVLFSVVTGPHTGFASPCGCSVPPGLLERE
ncbi:hypothetical protein [Natrinema sp. DC36]|jgi:hypothetical protein|uniref:hypothetical protein n=1 Tax=Natrinema sp. DC36 TaxID=2878680 RepID=UPI001CF07589|nr:hypothetical protein [Natrinema sp. DC36]